MLNHKVKVYTKELLGHQEKLGKFLIIAQFDITPILQSLLFLFHCKFLCCYNDSISLWSPVDASCTFGRSLFSFFTINFENIPQIKPFFPNIYF